MFCEEIGVTGVEEFFHMIVAALLFLSSLIICFAGVDRLTEMIASPIFPIEDAVAFESNLQTETDVVEISQLEATLLRETELVIWVVFLDGTSIEISADSIDMEAIQRVYQADAAGYIKSYEYDAQGAIKRLTFKEIRRE